MQTKLKRSPGAMTCVGVLLALVLGGCGSGGGEPPDSTSTASSPSASSASEDEQRAEAAQTAFKKFWEISQTQRPFAPPTQAQRDLMTDESYQRQVEFAKTAPPVEGKGKDELTATSVMTKRSTAGATAAIEVCYLPRRQFILTEDVQQGGRTLKKGTDVRTDQEGQPIKAGTEMVNLVTMKRGRQDDDPWRVDSTRVGYKKQCSAEGKTP